jgi:hypothetical protein
LQLQLSLAHAPTHTRAFTNPSEACPQHIFGVSLINIAWTCCQCLRKGVRCVVYQHDKCAQNCCTHACPMSLSHSPATQSFAFISFTCRQTNGFPSNHSDSSRVSIHLPNPHPHHRVAAAAERVLSLHRPRQPQNQKQIAVCFMSAAMQQHLLHPLGGLLLHLLFVLCQLLL